jgi:hypothetical protein
VENIGDIWHHYGLKMKPSHTEHIATEAGTPAPDPSVEQPVSSMPPAPSQAANPPREIGGRDGPEPTRFGDWEKAGRCIDF